MGIEHGYLKDLMRAYLGGARRPLPAPGGVEWKRLARLLVDHKVAGTLLPLVARDGLSAELSGWLDSVHQSFTRSTILRLLHLEKVLTALTATGCHPVVLKGSVLACGYYRKPEDRYLNDLDILVERAEIESACFALGELGLVFVDTQANRLYYEKYHFHWIMGDDLGNVVEIHWDLNLVESLYRFDLAGFRRRAVRADLNGREMVVPEPTDLMLHIVTQSIEGGFFELRHVMDAALILPRIADPVALAQRAREQNMEIALWALMRRVAHWTDAAVPAALSEAIEPHGTTARLLRRAIDGELILRGRVLSGHDLNQHFNWLCAPSGALRLRALRQMLFPGEAHWLEHGAGSRPETAGWDRLKVLVERVRSLLKLLAFGLRGGAGDNGLSPD